MSSSLSRLVQLAKTTALVSLLASPAFATTAMVNPFSLSDPESGIVDASTLKRLPLGADELTFNGETSSRSVSIYLTASEAARIRAFQVASLGSIVTLPDRSNLKISINGRHVASLVVTSGDRPKRSLAQIPAGVLTAGYNQVKMDVTLAHRVDCSIAATYELWARIDPAETGFVGGSTHQEIRKLRDLISEPLEQDGATHIHVRLRADAAPDVIAQNAQFLNYVVRRGRAARPIVDVGEGAGAGAGFDLFLSKNGEAPKDESLRVVSQDDDLTFLRNAQTGRLTIMMSAVDDRDLKQKLDRIVALDDEAGPVGMNGEALTFDRLGLSTGPFQGRHYLSNAVVELPDDFLSANYDKVQLLLDAAHSDTLDPESGLLVKVNGSLVASLPFQEGRSETFSRRQISLPLNSFKPGHNEVTIEGFVASPQDDRCDVTNPSHETRLDIAPTSELRFPALAHMATFPRLASAILSHFSEGQTLHVYTPDTDFDTLGFAFTALANLGRDMPSAPNLEFHPYAPSLNDPPGLVASSFSGLSPDIAAAIRRIAFLPDETNAAPAVAPLAQASATPATDLPDWKTQSLVGLQQLIGGKSQSNWMTLPSSFLVVGAITPRLSANDAVLPRFAPSVSQWIVVASSDPDAQRTGLSRFTANGVWSRLSGQLSAYDVSNGELKSVEPTEASYVMPPHIVLADVRPILGGLLSGDAALGIGAMGATIFLLGLLTHALVRRTGVR